MYWYSDSLKKNSGSEYRAHSGCRVIDAQYLTPSFTFQIKGLACTFVQQDRAAGPPDSWPTAPARTLGGGAGLNR